MTIGVNKISVTYNFSFKNKNLFFFLIKLFFSFKCFLKKFVKIYNIKKKIF